VSPRTHARAHARTHARTHAFSRVVRCTPPNHREHTGKAVGAEAVSATFGAVQPERSAIDWHHDMPHGRQQANRPHVYCRQRASAIDSQRLWRVRMRPNALSTRRHAKTKCQSMPTASHSAGLAQQPRSAAQMYHGARAPRRSAQYTSCTEHCHSMGWLATSQPSLAPQSLHRPMMECAHRPPLFVLNAAAKVTSASPADGGERRGTSGRTASGQGRR
jgi:hypothetical protein